MSVSGTRGSREAQHSWGLHDMAKCLGGFNLRVLVNTSLDIPSQVELLKSALVQKGSPLILLAWRLIQSLRYVPEQGNGAAKVRGKGTACLPAEFQVLRPSCSGGERCPTEWSQRSSGLAVSLGTAPAATGSSQQGRCPAAALAGQSVARIAAESLASQHSFSQNHLEHTKSSPTELAGATSHVGWRC